MHPAESKIKAKTGSSIHENISHVNAFLGFIKYYGKFSPNLATILRPLYNLLTKNAEFNSDSKCARVFNIVKQKLVTALTFTMSLTHHCHVMLLFCGLGCALSIVKPGGIKKPICLTHCLKLNTGTVKLIQKP